MKKVAVLIFIFSFFIISCGTNKNLNISKDEIAFSSINGEKSKISTFLITNKSKIDLHLNFELKGENSNFFKFLTTIPNKVEANSSLEIPIQFQPNADFVGVANAQLLLNLEKKSPQIITFRGLSTKGLEGKNEPALSWVLQTLGYGINLGWETLANTIKPDLQGEEISQTLFKKASNKDVEIIPIARYSPAFNLPFGYYIIKKDAPVLVEVGVLSDSKEYPEHQTLFPKVSKGNTAFNPKEEFFGIYTTSPSHNAYSEDKWNKKFHKKNAAHASRIYQLKNTAGKIIANQYLICFEEAFNGDYQDYVFILKNVKIIE